MININEHNLLRPHQAKTNRHMYVGMPLYERFPVKYVNGIPYHQSNMRFEAWVTKDLYDSLHVSDELCEQKEFMIRKEKGWKTASLYTGARAILKEEVTYEGDDKTYYCVVMEYDQMLSHEIDHDKFLEKVQSGESISKMVNEGLIDVYLADN